MNYGVYNKDNSCLVTYYLAMRRGYSKKTWDDRGTFSWLMDLSWWLSSAARFHVTQRCCFTHHWWYHLTTTHSNIDQHTGYSHIMSHTSTIVAYSSSITSWPTTYLVASHQQGCHQLRPLGLPTGQNAGRTGTAHPDAMGKTMDTNLLKFLEQSPFFRNFNPKCLMVKICQIISYQYLRFWWVKSKFFQIQLCKLPMFIQSDFAELLVKKISCVPILPWLSLLYPYYG